MGCIGEGHCAGQGSRPRDERGQRLPIEGQIKLILRLAEPESWRTPVFNRGRSRESRGAAGRGNRGMGVVGSPMYSRIRLIESPSVTNAMNLNRLTPMGP
jgi:hypothetical protein